MNNWKVIPTTILATVLIFGAGVFTGGMLVDDLHHAHVKAAQKRSAAATTEPTNQLSQLATNVAVIPTNKPVKPPEILRKDFLQRLDAELKLDKEQHDAVQKIINDGQNEMRKVVQDARLEIREALTDDQRHEFDELMKRPFHRPLFSTNAPAATNPAAATAGKAK